MTASDQPHLGDPGLGALAGPELASLLSVGVFVSDADGRCTYVNERWCELSGLEADTAVGHPWWAGLHPDDVEGVTAGWRSFARGDGPFSMEFRFVGRDGRARGVRGRARSGLDDQGQVTRCVGTVTGLGDGRASLARIMGLIERSSDMVVVIDAAGAILWANAATERVLGYDRSAKFGTPVLDLVHPDDAARATEGLARSSRENDLAPIRVRVQASDGAWREVEVVSTNMLDEPLIRGIVLSARDITERTRLERRIHELEHSFEASIRYSPVGRALIDLDGRWLQVNTAFADMVGRHPNDLIGRPGIELVHPDDRPRVRAETRRVQTGEVDSVTVDIRFLRPDGDTVWGRSTVWFVLDDRGEPLYCASDITDVTEVRAAREAQDRAQHEFEALIEQSSDIITVLEPDGSWRSSSDAGPRILGYERGFDPEGGIFSLVHPDDADRAWRVFDEVRRDERSPGEPLVLRVRAADGEYRFLETVAHNLSADPAMHGIVLNSRDVTERIRTEVELHAAENRLGVLLEQSSDLIVVLDAEGRVAYLSPAGERLVGRSADDLAGVLGTDLVHPDDLELVLSKLAEVLAEPGATDAVTCRVLHTDGSYRWVEAIGRNLLDDPSTPGIVLNIRDITERLESEATLREAQARFAALVDQASDLITVNDLAGTITYVSPSASSVLGYDPAELIGTETRDLVHPDDVARVVQTAAEQFARGVAEPIQFRARHRDGSWRVLEAIVTDMINEPSVQGIVANARDITERRAAEQRGSELVEILEAANELVVVSAPAGEIVYANRSARTLLGAHERGHVSALSSERSRERLRTEIMPLVRQRGSWSGELELVDPDGRLIPVAVTVQAHRDENATLVRVATVAHDISDLKAAQRRLEFEATHDALTGLSNRALFREIGDRALARGARTNEAVAVLFLDLDGFKLVNDSYGHDTGDLLLGMVAQRLRETVRAGDVLARLGGDEFVILCEHPRSERQVLELSDRIIETVSAPFTIADDLVHVGVSIGIAFSHGSDAGIGELIREADIALYRAKNDGRGRAQLYDETLVG